MRLGYLTTADSRDFDNSHMWMENKFKMLKLVVLDCMALYVKWAVEGPHSVARLKTVCGVAYRAAEPNYSDSIY